MFQINRDVKSSRCDQSKILTVNKLYNLLLFSEMCMFNLLDSPYDIHSVDFLCCPFCTISIEVSVHTFIHISFSS